MFIIIIALALSFIIKLLFIYRFSNDDWHHMWLISWHSKKRKLNYELRNCIPNGEFTYPSLVFFLISRFKKKFRKPLAISTNYIADILSCFIVFLIGIKIQEYAIPNNSIYGFSLPIIVTIIYYTSPSLSPYIARIGGISPRPLGTFIFLCFALTAIISFEKNSLFSFFVLISLNIFAFMISMFCSQVLLFASIGLSILINYYQPLVALIISYILPFILDIKVKQNILYSFNFKLWYIDNYKNSSAQNINFIKGLFKVFSFKRLPYVYRYNELFVNNSLCILAIFHPLLLILLIYFIDNPVNLLIYPNEIKVIITLLFSCIFGFVISSFSYFKILGSPQRYLEYSLAFYILLFPFFFGKDLNHFFLLAILIYNVILSLIILPHVKFQKYNNNLNINKDIENASKYINENIKCGRIFVNPFKESFIYLYLQSEGYIHNKIKFYNRFILRKNERAFKYYTEDIFYEKCGINFESFYQNSSKVLKEKYNISHIVLDKSWFKYLPNKVSNNIKKDLKKNVVYTSNKIVIYKA